MIEPLNSLLSQWNLDVVHFKKETISPNIYRISTDKAVYFLKNRIETSLLERYEEYSLTQYLQHKGLNVETPVLTKGNDPFVEKESGFYSLYGALEGETKEEFPISMSLVFSIGEYLGLLHKLMSTYKSREEPIEWNVFFYLESWRKERHHTQVGAWAKKNFFQYDEVLSNYKEMPLQFIHSDFHLKNLLIVDNKMKGLIDFERIRKAPRVVDVAYFITGILRKQAGEGKLLFIEEFLKGYENKNGLTPHEKDCLPYLILILLLQYSFFYEQRGFTNVVSKLLTCIDTLQKRRDYVETFKTF
ncbi:phosphotransferase enzyme family protein [Rossellomorea aquimaris]|uniref:phosphotransferase enzyme family protein n=1 Tax=Rossellomorea aquimaris TaxID=189382 RepID=UPI0007D04FD3|nr:phosphotransferase [Rossellomorea aquimaris]